MLRSRILHFHVSCYQTEKVIAVEDCNKNCLRNLSFRSALIVRGQYRLYSATLVNRPRRDGTYPDKWFGRKWGVKIYNYHYVFKILPIANCNK